MSQAVSSSSELIATVKPNAGFIRQKTLLKDHLPFSAATLWRLVNAGKFPKPVKVTDQITAWRLSDITLWAKDPAGYVATPQTEAKK